MTTTKLRLDNVEKAITAWGELPDWVLALAEACNVDNQTIVGRRLGYTSAVVSNVLANKYGGDMPGFEQTVRGALMAETVNCPRQGDIGRNVCLEWQKKPFEPTSSHRVRMFQACRSGCPHSRLRSDDTDQPGSAS